MASRRSKILITAALVGTLMPAGLRIVAHAQERSTSAPSARIELAAAVDNADNTADAQQPRPQPSQPASTAPVNPTRLPGFPFERMWRPVAGSPMPGEQEWRQAAALFSDISPARWHVFEQVLAKPGRRDRAKRFLYARYNELRDLQKSNPNLYQAKLQQIRFEDEVFRLDTAIRAANAAGASAEAESLRTELRDKVMERVNRDLADREQRLRQLQERIDREKAALEQDKVRADVMGDNRSNNIRRLSDRYRNWAAGKNPDGSNPGNNQQNKNNRNTQSAPPPPPQAGDEKSGSFDD